MNAKEIYSLPSESESLMEYIKSIEDIELDSTWTDRDGAKTLAIVLDKIGDSVFFSYFGEVECLEFGIFIYEFWLLGGKDD